MSASAPPVTPEPPGDARDPVAAPAAPPPTSRAGRAVVAAGLVVGVAVLLVRLAARLERPALFAEDGTVFSIQAWTDGWTTLGEPYAGYLHLVPRLVALAASPLPFHDLRAVYTWTATVVTALAFLPVLSPRIAPVLPSPAARATAYVALCLTPHLVEAGGVVASLIFVLGTTQVLLALLTPPTGRRARGTRVAEAVVLALCVLSGPLVAFLWPLVLRRWWVHRARGDLLLLGISLAGTAVQVVVFLRSPRQVTQHSLDLVPAVLLRRLGAEWMLGEGTVVRAADSPRLLAAAAVVLVGVLVVATLRLGLLGLWLGLTALVTPTAAVLAYGKVYTMPAAGDRHLVLPGCLMLLVLVSALFRPPGGAWRRRTTRALAALLLAAGVPGLVAHFPLSPRPVVPTSARLDAFQRCLEQRTHTCVIFYSPRGFVLLVPPATSS